MIAFSEPEESDVFWANVYVDPDGNEMMFTYANMKWATEDEALTLGRAGFLLEEIIYKLKYKCTMRLSFKASILHFEGDYGPYRVNVIGGPIFEGMKASQKEPA